MAVAKNEKLRNFWPDIYMHEECHKVQGKPLQKRFLTVHPLGVALNQNCPPLLKWKLKIIKWCCLIAQMKRLDALIATQKTGTNFDAPFLKKLDLTVKKVQKNCSHFTVLFLISPPKWYLKQSQFLYYWTQWIKTLHISLQTPYEHEQFWKKIRKNYNKGQFFVDLFTVISHSFKNGSSK